ncbi:uncharacterized protein LOC108651696 isoform X6 [Drosophila navojoa]|uniref:uncharacterized protein LOC108651696 isoform X6 n=1 Tax=Drosophila navojoa TaxID=7232 RepID=UPI0011BEFC8D|nr:uncharacterized protein LOC108651696 isoform X6 [Drosophila navojoa]
MIGRAWSLALSLLVLNLAETIAYHQPGSYNVGQSGLSATTQAQDQVACPSHFRGLKPYEHDCHRFINCAEGRPVIQTCGPGTAFNALIQTCDHQSQVSCEGQPGRSSRLLERPSEPRCEPGFRGLQPHPSDCTKFLNCDNGQTFIQSCGPGTAFSPTQLVCDYKYKVNCGAASGQGEVKGTSVGLECPPGVRDPVPYPNDQSKYIICETGVHPRLEQCLPGWVFNAHSLSCSVSGASSASADYSSAVQFSGLLCPGGVDGLFVHPFDQTKFLNCKAGKTAVQSCSPGQVFSISNGYCQPKTQLLYTDYVAYFVSQISIEYSLMLTRCPEGTDGHHLYPYDASKYVRCAAGGELSIQNCGESMAYSFIQRACRPSGQLTRAERVKFFSEQSLQEGSYSYTDSQAFQSALKSCPVNLRGNYAYPFHAGHYVLCQNGLLQVESCPAGSVYSLSTKRCSARQQLSSHDFLDYAYISGQLSTNFMQDLTTVTCPANAQGYYLHPFDCTKYLNCRDQQTSIESCDKGEVFSISRRLCVARDQLVAPYDRVDYLTETQHEFYQGNQINQEDRELQTDEQTGHGNEYIFCPPGASGVRAHPYDCTKFLNCANGQTFIQSCEPGKALNAVNGVCDFIEKVDCSGRTKETLPPSNIIYNPNAISDTADSYRLVCPDQVYGLFAHPFDARSYIYCSEGHTVVRQCPASEVFSLSRSYCLQGELVPVTDRVAFNYAEEHLESVVSCPHGAVGNYAYPFDCTKYLSCGEGLTRLQSCPDGLHFSLSLRRCQPVEQVQRSDRVYLLNELRIFYEWWQQMHRLSRSTTINCPYGLIGKYQHPTEPNKYINCASHSAQAFIYSCPVGQVFSVSHRLCVPDSQVPEYDRCSYHQDTSSWIDLRYDNRESKAYVQPSHGPADQFARGSGVKTTVTASGNRWSNMNMDRPAGIGFGQPQSNGWSGQGSFYQQQAPAQSVLYVEGSLLPNRNYPPTTPNAIYKAPLAPMSPNTGNVEAVAPSPRQNFSRSHWPHRPYNPTLRGQRPLDLDDYQPEPDQLPSETRRDQFHSLLPTLLSNHNPTPHVHLRPSPIAGQRPLDLEYEPDEQDRAPANSFLPSNQSPSHGPRHPVADESNLFGGLQPPTPPPHAPGFKPIYLRPNSTSGQRRLDLDYNPTPSQPSTGFNPSHLHPISHAPALPGQRPVDLDYVPDSDSDTETTVDQSNPTYPEAPARVPTVPANHSPTYRGQPQPEDDESNLYGGLQPPTRPNLPESTTIPTTSTTRSNLRTFPIYPPVLNATPVLHPHYSPSYAGVAHSHNTSWQKVPPPNQVPDLFNDQDEYDDADYGDETITTTERSALKPPPFSHNFYNPTQSAAVAPPSKDALNEALRLMLRPYFNHSGNVKADSVHLAEAAIASAIVKPPISTTTQKTTPGVRHTPDDDVEMIVAGEQASLDIDSDDPSVVPDAGETARTEQTINPTTYASRYDTTDFQRGTRRVDINDSSTNANLNPNPQSNTNNWHSREFHRRHPNMPDPFEKPQHHHHHPHHHHHGPHPHQHSPSYHARHPNLPNPFNPINEEHKSTTKTKFESDPNTEFEVGDFLPNPNAEATTTSEINLRTGFSDEPCEFHCGGGKCVKQSEVCDGVNNCGNRRDESQCEHLGYQVRLTGGESPHMGRIEVKVNGQWGYVCDDKFGLPDADVVCRELGYKMGASEVRGNSYYEPTERNFNYVMDKLECRGNETKLKDCDFMGWGVHNCAVDEVAGVVCKVPVLKCPNNSWLCEASKECIPPAFVCDNTVDCADKSDESDAVCKAPIEYRLEGGRSSLEGRLEVKYHGVWGSVCDDDFNVRAAQVACNSLGYYGEAKIEKNIFGPGSGPIWLDQVMCLGNETSIDLCRHWNWGEHHCNHTEDVSLRCTAGPPPRQARQRLRLQALSKDKSAGSASNISLSDIGLWERSSKALRTPRRCGIFKDDLFDEFLHPEQRVVQGNVARRGRHPWQATIRTRGRGGISSHWCGAVVISKRHLLTAAHCVYGHPKGAYFVRVGDHYANIAEHSEVDSFIETWYTHEQFRQPTHMNNDIALVVLKTPLKFNDYVQPICLPERGAPLLENRTCTISGWGSIKSGVSTPSQELRAAQLPILPDTTCKQMNVYGDAMTEGMFCAGSMDASVDACEGDSGGPLVCSDEDGETLYGIISWGQHCGYQNRPGVYVRVCHYVDWIYEKINQSLRRLK